MIALGELSVQEVAFFTCPRDEDYVNYLRQLCAIHSAKWELGAYRAVGSFVTISDRCKFTCSY